MSYSDADLKLALDALDAKRVPQAAAAWEARLLLLLEKERSDEARPTRRSSRSRVTRGRLRLLVAACLVLAATIVFFASGAAAYVGIPNPLGWIKPGNGNTPRESASPSPSPSRSPSPSPSPSPTASHSKATSSPKPSRTHEAEPTNNQTPRATQSELPPSWSGGQSGAKSTLLPSPSGTRADLRAVDFVGDRGWAVGAAGTILTSADGGDSWSAQSSGHDDWLFGVAFADGTHGWAVGGAYGGTVLGTQDGGISWQKQGTAGRQLHAVTAADKSHAWAVGTSILATADGSSWHELQAPPFDGLLDVVAVSAVHVWAVGWGGMVPDTGDGGKNWRSQSLGADVTLTSVSLIDARHGWVAGYAGSGISDVKSVLFATSDGGSTWERRGNGESGTQLDDVVFVDEAHGWASGRYQKRELCLETSDGGSTWQAMDVSRRLAPVAVDAVGSSAACAVGDRGAVYVLDGD